MKSCKVYIAGHTGMVGRAVVRSLERAGYGDVITADRCTIDLRDQRSVQEFFATKKPDIVIDAAARVGGILANRNFPYQFLMENLQIQNNLIDSSLDHNVQKFIFIASSCIYPESAPQPLREENLLSGPLENNTEAYAVAKIAGVKACEAIRQQYQKQFFSLVPTNLYGSFDTFGAEKSHVIPAMIRKFDEAKVNGNTPVTLWGSGRPFREFLHVDDLADAVKFAIENKMEENLYNVGTGSDLTIKALAELIQNIVGHTGEIFWDSSKPDGTARKLMDVSKLKNKGWSSSVELQDGLCKTYEWYSNNKKYI
ncbi:GDP-L-fucose synthase family protein [Kaistella palustris]|uniref:GDP-L-fucose synthase family protein n=1 Tax=Kaistella palustris TaxID=493376 RepID=UPI0004885CB6|nr:GDP-L-fucose synthase [Kaistella palustris]